MLLKGVMPVLIFQNRLQLDGHVNPAVNVGCDFFCCKEKAACGSWVRQIRLSAGTPCTLEALRKSLCSQDIDTLATFNKNLEEIKDAAIFVKGNVIEWVGKTADLPKQYSSADKTLSMKNRVVIPGMVHTCSSPVLCLFRLTPVLSLSTFLSLQVNTHHHMFQCITRCVGQVTA